MKFDALAYSRFSTLGSLQAICFLKRAKEELGGEAGN